MLAAFALLGLAAPELSLVREEKHGIPGMYYGSMDAADFDGDGRIDLVLSGNFDTVFDSARFKEQDAERLSDRVRVYKNVSEKGGAIRFELAKELTNISGQRGSLVRIGDFNGDGKKDFAVEMRNGADAAVFFNKGGFSFDKSVLKKGFGCNSTSLGMAAADVDHDGHDDLIFNSDGGVGGGLWYRYDPCFWCRSDWTAKQTNFSHRITYGGALAAGDLDGDGFPELAVSGNAKDAFGSHKCENLMIGQINKNKKGAFVEEPLAIIGSESTSACEGMDNGGLWIGDLDLDGKNDLVVAGSATPFNGESGKNGQQYDFAVLFNADGSGKRYVAWQNIGPQDPDGTTNGGVGNIDFPNIAAGDLNGDKLPDVFVQGHRRDYAVRFDVNGDGNDKDNPYVFEDMIFVNNGARSFTAFPLGDLLPKLDDAPKSLAFINGRPRFAGEGGQAIADFNGDGKNDLVFSGATLPFHTNGVNAKDMNTASTLSTYVFRNTR